MLGLLVGYHIGSRFLVIAHVKVLRLTCSTVIVGLAVEIIYSGVAGEALVEYSRQSAT